MSTDGRPPRVDVSKLPTAAGKGQAAAVTALGQAVLDGTAEPGLMLPSASVLAAHLHSSPPVVERALRLLQAAGMLRPVEVPGPTRSGTVTWWQVLGAPGKATDRAR